MVWAVVLLPSVKVLLLVTVSELIVNAPAGMFIVMVVLMTTSSAGRGTCPSVQLPGTFHKLPVEVFVWAALFEIRTREKSKRMEVLRIVKLLAIDDVFSPIPFQQHYLPLAIRYF